MKLDVGEAVKTIRTNIALKQNLIGYLRFHSTKIRMLLKKDSIIFSKLADTNKVFSDMRHIQ